MKIGDIIYCCDLIERNVNFYQIFLVDNRYESKIYLKDLVGRIYFINADNFFQYYGFVENEYLVHSLKLFFSGNNIHPAFGKMNKKDFELLNRE